jgi:putative DNA primase/helicase
MIVAETIARRLGARRVGAGWMARCPRHHDRTPSLSIRDSIDDKVLVHCHAGCEQLDVIGALKQQGLWPDHGPGSISEAARRMPVKREQDQDDARRSKNALAIWHSSKPAHGTPVESYLASRNIDLSPDSLRFHAGLRHCLGGIWPAMVALVTDGRDGTPLAVHRTFLARDGSGKAPVKPQKMMLGPCRGGVVRLGDPGEVLMVGEGIETCLSAMQSTGNPVWAALSTSGLRSLALPEEVRDVIVLADGDDAGEAAARDCARRCKREGRRARIARPPWGMDFADLLRVGSPPIRGNLT